MRSAVGMRLGDLLQAVDAWNLHGSKDVKVCGMTYDSRRVRPGYLFVPWRNGRRYGDGHRFIADALERGAAAVVAEPTGAFDLEAVATRAPVVLVPNTRRALADLAAHFFGHPSRRLRLIGVTGTNGKTTTTHLIRELLMAGGKTVGLIGTLGYRFGDRVLHAERTTPQASDLQELLAEMVAGGCETAVMEVTSIALLQDRVRGCEFDVGVFTNLGRDHLDDHGSMEAYAAAKRRLFAMLGRGGAEDSPRKKGPKAAILNLDDPESARIRSICRVPIWTYGIDAPADFRATHVRNRPSGTTFLLETPEGTSEVRIPLPGRFNLYNTLAAVAAAYVEGVPIRVLTEKLPQVTAVPGRFERIEVGQPFSVIVDYAHTPDGLENVLSTAKTLTPGRIIVVFGCGGDRDRGKRPQMGEIAARLGDYLFVTSDNPRSEDPYGILREIENGIKASPRRPPHELIVDRREAIRRAVEIAREEDMVVIAGKGHETGQIVQDRVIPFDDREVAAEAVRDRLRTNRR